MGIEIQLLIDVGLCNLDELETGGQTFNEFLFIAKEQYLTKQLLDILNSLQSPPAFFAIVEEYS